MTKILIIGDSLASERKQNPPELIIWPKVVSKHLGSNFDVTNVSRPYNTSQILTDASITSETDVVIIQVGIVDCAPRKVTRRVRTIISRAPRRLREISLSLCKRKASKVYVTENRFERNFRDFLQRSIGKKVLIVPILSASPSLLASNPLIEPNIERYNALLEKVCKEYHFASCIDVSAISTSDYFMDDGYHLSQAGHHALASLIISVVKNEL